MHLRDPRCLVFIGTNHCDPEGPSILGQILNYLHTECGPLDFIAVEAGPRSVHAATTRRREYRAEFERCTNDRSLVEALTSIPMYEGELVASWKEQTRVVWLLADRRADDDGEPQDGLQWFSRVEHIARAEAEPSRVALIAAAAQGGLRIMADCEANPIDHGREAYMTARLRAACESLDQTKERWRGAVVAGASHISALPDTLYSNCDYADRRRVWCVPDWHDSIEFWLGFSDPRSIPMVDLDVRETEE